MNCNTGIWWKTLTAAAAVGILAAGPVAAQKTTLNVYTALETDQLKAYQEGFNKAYPDIELQWVRDSTGVITAKLLAEKAAPKADVIMGVAATSMGIFDAEGMLQPYAPAGLARIAPQYRDAKNPPAWVGMDVWGATICFNTAEAAKRNIPKPETWKDLTKPVYKGQIVMPHPASSGTGYFDVTAWLQVYGEADGWKFMDGLHENIAQYMHSGSRPCAAAANGEYVVGISFEYRANKRKGAGQADRPRVSEGRSRLGSGGHRHLQGHEEPGGRAEADGLGGLRRGNGAVREELRDRRGDEPVAAAAQCAGQLRVDAGQERLRLGIEEPRQDSRRVEQALRIKSCAEVGLFRHRGERAEC